MRRSFGKYIVIKEDDKETIYTFDTYRTHKSVAREMTKDNLDMVVGAGFCDNSKCWGDSMSLNIWSREADTDLLLNDDFWIDLK